MVPNACNQISGFEILHCIDAIITYYLAKAKPIELPKWLSSDRLIYVVFRCLDCSVMNAVSGMWVGHCLSGKHKTRIYSRRSAAPSSSSARPTSANETE